jgi:hypothetical protein
LKNLAIIVAAFFISTTVFSQELDLGIKLGSNFASISGAQQGSSSRTGFQAGAFAGIKFSEKTAIQLDVLYSQQGADFDIAAFELSYVSLPLVFKYYVAGGLNLQAGPQFGILVDDNIKELYTEVVEAQTSDVSGIIGLGYDLPFGLRLDGRYNFGFTDVLKSIDGKNSVVSIAVGFSFM